MGVNAGNRNFSGALVCSLGLMVFSRLVHSGFPLRLISYGALVLVAWIMSRQLKTYSDLKKITGEFSFSIKTFLYIVLGIFTGISMSVFYRWHLDARLFPSFLLPFAIIAALIGSTEELVFRGYLQSQVAGFGSVAAILFSSLSHTGYKYFLFISPALQPVVDTGFLAFWTFLFGMLAGTIRHLSGSVWPVVIAHALFDILVYGENVVAPWWVW